MWRIRESVAEASRAEGPGLSYDVTVAVSRIPEFIDKGLKAALDILPRSAPIRSAISETAMSTSPS